jgi:hypothetical protein
MVEVNGLLNKLMLTAKEDRARSKYSEDESFVPKLIFIGLEDQVAVTPAGWRSEEEKYAMMRAAAEAARLTFSQAIAVASDVRWVVSDAFCEHFQIEHPRSMEPAHIEEFQKRYLAILSEHDGQVKNLPRQLWKEAVMVAIKGPRCGTHARLAPYDRGPGDTVHYLPRDPEEEHRYQMNLIPEWWH